MRELGTLRSDRRPRLALALAAALCALLLVSALAESAAAAGIVGKDGKVYACYRTKGKAKGTVRLVAKKKHCRKGEKKLSWNATGQAGDNGQSGSNGESGPGGEPGAAGLEARVEKLTNRVESLEDKLKGITNTDLTGVLSKLNGVSATQLQEAVKSIANVNALCAQGKKLTEQSNSLGSALGAAEVIGGLGLSLLFPTALPSPLQAFGCPA
jgi:hypothetical protein